MKAQSPQPVVFSSISEMMQQLGLPDPMHPLIALIDYKDIKLNLVDAGTAFMLGFYKISFKYDFKGQVKYGQGFYDFEEGGLAFLAPNQTVTMSADENNYQGYSFFFHADLIRNTALGKRIHQYGFFSYDVKEALFLSEGEKKVIGVIFESIAAELENHTDHFTEDIVVSQIEQLLNYSNRFYSRQFVTRRSWHTDLTVKLHTYLDNRFTHTELSLSGLPTVQEVADYLEVSPRYLTDLLRALTGRSTQQVIHDQLIEKAKLILRGSKLTVAEIAYELGFEHPQSFNKLFKQKTNMSPLQFRQSF